jgi:transcriptional regulator with XRE-family HTH domain
MASVLADPYCFVMTPNNAGVLLREWRQLRRFSQLDLAVAADVSAKHLSYVETGRSRPSPEMIQHLSNHLDIPLRERNAMLLAAGHAPRHQETRHNAAVSTELHELLHLVLSGFRYPAFAVDAHWNLIAANSAMGLFLAGVGSHLLEPPVNVIRLTLDPAGLAPRIVNFPEYGAHILERLRRLAAHHPSPQIATLIEEFGHLVPTSGMATHETSGLALPIELTVEGGITVRLVSTITTFGAPLDVSLSELALETFYPADAPSKGWLDTHT